jgi:hypothetical protein
MPLSYWYATVPFDDGEGSKERGSWQDGSNAGAEGHEPVQGGTRTGASTPGYRPGARNGLGADRPGRIPLRNFADGSATNRWTLKRAGAVTDEFL